MKIKYSIAFIINFNLLDVPDKKTFAVTGFLPVPEYEAVDSIHLNDGTSTNVFKLQTWDDWADIDAADGEIQYYFPYVLKLEHSLPLSKLKEKFADIEGIIWKEDIGIFMSYREFLKHISWFITQDKLEGDE